MSLLRVPALLPLPRHLLSSHPSCIRASAQARSVADPPGLLPGAETHALSLPGASGVALRQLAHSPHPVPRPWATSVPGTRTRGWDPLHPVLCCLALVGGWSSGHCDFWGRARPPAVLSPCVLLFVHCGNQRRLPAGSRPGGQLCREAVEAPEPQRSFPGWPGGATAPAAGHCQDFPGRLSQQPGPGGLGGGEMAFVIIPGLAGAAGQPVTRALSLGHPSPAHFA